MIQKESVISLDRLFCRLQDIELIKGNGDWREHLQLTGEFLGESGEVEHWLKNYDKKVRNARERLKQKVKDETFLIVRIFKQNFYVHSNRSVAEVFYHDLQLAPAYSFNRFVYNQQVTIEQLAEFDADHLLLMICQEPETLAYWQTLRHSMLWQELKAVRSNRVYVISSDPNRRGFCFCISIL